MSEVSLLPDPDLSPETHRELTALTEQRMLIPARQAGYELRLVGATVYPQQQTIARTKYGKWLFVDHWVDPTADEDGDLLVPPDEHRRVVELERVIGPDLLFVGHQLPASWREGDPIPKPPPPKRLREKDEGVTQGLQKGMSWLQKAVTATLVGAAAAPVVATGAIATLGAGLDPIIFGGVIHPRYPAVSWTVLAQWEWE